MKSLTGSLLKLAVFVAFASILGAFVFGTLMGPDVGDTKSYKAMFHNASGLRAGDQVRVAGVPVGRITKVDLLDANNVRVTFSANKNQQVTSDTHAVIRYANLIGARFLALTNSGTGGTPLSPGDTIPAERTVPALSLTALFNGFRPLFAALDPGQINQLSTEIVAVLQGQSGTIGSLLSHVASLTTDLADRDQVFVEIIDGLGQVLRVGAQHDKDLLSLLDSFQTIASQLKAEGPAIVDALDATSGMATSVDQLLTGLNANHLSDNIKDLATLAAKLAEIQGPIDQTLKAFPDAFTIFNRLTQNGNYVNSWPCLLAVQSVDSPTFRLSDIGQLGVIPPALAPIFNLIPINVPLPLVVPDGDVGDENSATPVCAR